MMSSTAAGEEQNNDALRLSNDLAAVPGGDYLHHHKIFNRHILHLTNVFGIFLQLNNGGGGSTSPFVTDFLTMRALLLAFCLYTASLATADTRITRSNIDSDPAEAEFTSNITVVCGTLVLTIQLFLLVPAFGRLALVIWAINLVRVIKKSWGYLKRLYQNRVDELKTLKEELFLKLKVWWDGDDTAGHETELEKHHRRTTVRVVTVRT